MCIRDSFKTSGGELAQRLGLWAKRPPPPADAGQGTRTLNWHMRPTPPSTSGGLKSSTVQGSCHDYAEAGCSWRKWAPRSSCAQYSLVMNSRWAQAVDTRLATSCSPIRGRLA
eukprot:14819414-Alexandrium_andersonii.AAC.1